MGTAIAAELARGDWHVVGTDLPGTGAGVAADLRQPAAAAVVVGRVMDSFGRLDLLVNNAAAMYHGSLALDDLDRWWETIEVNLNAPARLVRAALAPLRQSKGQVVNISSVFGVRPEAGYSAYCASKAGLIGLTKALALELAPAIGVNAIAPGHVDTPQQQVDAGAAGITRSELYEIYAKTMPIGRVLQPVEIARAVVYLSGETGYTGSCLCLDGGMLLG